MKPATFRLVEQCLDEMRYRVNSPVLTNIATFSVHPSWDRRPVNAGLKKAWCHSRVCMVKIKVTTQYVVGATEKE
jgi:hypothetical protein